MRRTSALWASSGGRGPPPARGGAQVGEGVARCNATWTPLHPIRPLSNSPNHLSMPTCPPTHPVLASLAPLRARAHLPARYSPGRTVQQGGPPPRGTCSGRQGGREGKGGERASCRRVGKRLQRQRVDAEHMHLSSQTASNRVTSVRKRGRDSRSAAAGRRAVHTERPQLRIAHPPAHHTLTSPSTPAGKLERWG